MVPDTYCIELIYSDCCAFLSVKGKSEWRTKRIAIKHATDILNVKATDGIKKDLIAIDVWKNDQQLVKRLDVQIPSLNDQE